MEVKHKKHEAPNQQTTEEPGSEQAADQSTLEDGEEVAGQAKEAVSEIYAKTTRTVSETYEKAMDYGARNPGKTVLIALGIGVGLGFFLGAKTRHSGTSGRFARPVISALSDVALELFR